MVRRLSQDMTLLFNFMIGEENLRAEGARLISAHGIEVAPDLKDVTAWAELGVAAPNGPDLKDEMLRCDPNVNED